MQQLRVDDVLIAWSVDGEVAAHPDERAAASHSRHRHAFETARMLLRRLIAELAAVDPAAVEFDSACPDCGLPHGKPRVAAPAAAHGIHLSVSHAGALTVVAAAPGHAVGVDAEPADASVERLAAIDEVAGPSSDALKHWTRVEAVLKADGRGLRVDPRQVRVTGQRAMLESASYRLDSVDIGGFVVSVAVADAEAQVLAD